MATVAASDKRMLVLKTLIAAVGVGHLVVGLMFWFAPHLAVEEILAWGPASGWTAILGSYDLSVAFALSMAFRDPVRNVAIIRFVGFLLILHAATHAYYIVWGDAPARFWLVSSYLAIAALLLLWFARDVTDARPT